MRSEETDGFSPASASTGTAVTPSSTTPTRPQRGGSAEDIVAFWQAAFLLIREFIGAKAHWLTVYGLATFGVAVWLRIDYNEWIHSAEFIAMITFAAVLVVAGVVAQLFEQARTLTVEPKAPPSRAHVTAVSGQLGSGAP